jgi:hypothetical protein
MTARDFCYWLQGFFEVTGGNPKLTSEQAETIQRHLSLVFAHDIDPKAGGPAVQKKLNDLHGGGDKDVVYRC